MNGSLIAIIVILVLCLVLAGIIYYAYCRIRENYGIPPECYSVQIHDRGHEAERSGSGDDTEVRILRDKSVYASIMRDFPEFHYDEMKSRAENVLTLIYKVLPDRIRHFCRRERKN